MKETIKKEYKNSPPTKDKKTKKQHNDSHDLKTPNVRKQRKFVVNKSGNAVLEFYCGIEICLGKKVFVDEIRVKNKGKEEKTPSEK